MLVLMLVAWTFLSVVTALAVGKLVVLVERRWIGRTAQQLENPSTPPSTLNDNPHTIQVQLQETLHEAAAS